MLAESDDTVVVEGNHDFPESAMNREYVESSDRTSVCGWKGLASYYDVNVDGERSEAAAFYCAEPKKAAAEIRNRVAFWRGIEVPDG